MSLKVSETKWKSVLTSILDELTDLQYGRLLFDLDKIPQGVKSGKVREEIAQIIIEHFGTEGSISAIDKEMKQIPRMDAKVQDPLRPFVDKLKEKRKKNKEATSKRATDSGSVAKKLEPAAGATSKRAADSGSVAKRLEPAAGATSKRAADSGSVAKKLEPAAGATSKRAADSGSVAKRLEPAAGHQQADRGPSPDPEAVPYGPGPTAKTEGATSKRAADSGSVAKKLEPAAGATSKRAADSGSVAKRLEPAAAQLKSCLPDKVDSVGPKTGKRDLSLKPTASAKTSKVQSAAVQTGEMQIVRINKVNKTNTHLEAEFNGKMQTFYVTSRLLAEACGLKLEGDLPLSVEVKIQGNKITDIKNI